MKDISGNETRDRKDFSKIPTTINIPNLLEIQKGSYGMFLQLDIPPEQRQEKGLQAAFTSVFPIVDYNDTSFVIVIKSPEYRAETASDIIRPCSSTFVLA